MGASFRSSVFCGFKLEKSAVNKTVKKFDPDTGEPYNKEEFDYNQYSIGNLVFNEEESDEIAVGLGVHGLEIGYTTDMNDVFLGKIIVSSGDIAYGPDAKEFDTEVPVEVKDFAMKHGLKIKFFLIPNCSY